MEERKNGRMEECKKGRNVECEKDCLQTDLISLKITKLELIHQF
jgi:hypothetical protein